MILSIRLKALFCESSSPLYLTRYVETVVDSKINRALTWPSIWYCPLFSYGVVTASDLYVLLCGLPKLACVQAEPILILSDGFVSVGSKVLN